MPMSSGNKKGGAVGICPFADQSRRFDHSFAGSYTGGAWKGVLHSTETTGLPSYQSGGVAPHFTVDPKSGHIWQHYDTSRPSRALKHTGSIETNNSHAVQIEIVAYSDTSMAGKVGGLRVDQLTTAELAVVAKLMRWVESAHGIKQTAPRVWKAYPASAGTGNGVRFSGAAWAAFNGWCGHQHVPDNDHGDPSNINITALLQGDTEVITPEDRAAIAHDVWAYDQLGATGKAQAWTYLQVAANADALASSIAKKLPTSAGGSSWTSDQIAQVKQAVKDALKEGVA